MAEQKLSEKLSKIAKEIESLTVIEMADLAKYLEEKFGVSAIPQQAVVSSSTGPQNTAQEEKTSFTVVLTNAGANKLNVIKAVREIVPTLGLMDAKKLVESAPKEIAKDMKKEDAEAAKKKIEAAGGKIELK